MSTIALKQFLNKLDKCAGVIIDGYFTYSYTDNEKSGYFEFYASGSEYGFWYVDNVNVEVYNRADDANHFAFAKLMDVNKKLHHVSLLTYMQL